MVGQRASFLTPTLMAGVFSDHETEPVASLVPLRQRPASVSHTGRSCGQQCCWSSQQTAFLRGQQAHVKQYPKNSRMQQQVLPAPSKHGFRFACVRSVSLLGFSFKERRGDVCFALPNSKSHAGCAIQQDACRFPFCRSEDGEELRDGLRTLR